MDALKASSAYGSTLVGIPRRRKLHSLDETLARFVNFYLNDSISQANGPHLILARQRSKKRDRTSWAR